MRFEKTAFLIGAVVIFTSASVWEGAASVAAPGGEMPKTGYYVGTNSFPRNTVVDVTNLENGKTIRAIVAGGIETPGLLATLSRDAAGKIGLRSGAVGRISMIQPSDPIAFSRFTEGASTSENPDYDAAIPITGEAAYSSYKPESPAVPNAGPLNAIGWPFSYYYDFSSDPEYTENTAGSEASPDSAVLADSGADSSSAASAYTPEPEWDEFPNRSVVDLPDSVGRPREAPELTAAPAAPRTPPAPPPADETSPAARANAEYILSPAEERPPAAPSRSAFIDPAYIIPGIPDSAGERYAAAPEAAKPEQPAPAHTAAPSGDYTSPVPVIRGLEEGKYYVQIAAYKRTGLAELVESAVNRVGSSYPLTVLDGGSDSEYRFRLLLGPLNRGESGAMLQRVKSIGYKEAFVRRN